MQDGIIALVSCRYPWYMRSYSMLTIYVHMMFVENHKERINITVDMVLRIQKHSEGMLVNGRIH